jgi:2-oxoisovalerate dehydrogenase E1 component
MHPIKTKLKSTLSNAILLRGYEIMATAKAMSDFYENNFRLVSKYVHAVSRGHEAVQIALGLQMLPQDILGPYYRDDAMLLAINSTPYDLMLQLLAKRDDPFSGGRAYYAHPSLRDSDKPIMPHLSSATGMQAIPMTGAAMGLWYKEQVGLGEKYGKNAPIVVCSFGDASITEGEVSEAFQMAVLKKLPILYLVQDNGWDISANAAETRAQNAAEYAAGFKGLETRSIDGADFELCYSTIKEVIELIRKERRPFLIHAKVPLLTHHTSGVRAEWYRDDFEEHQTRDPLPRLRNILLNAGITEGSILDIENNAKELIINDFKRAQNADNPTEKDLFTHVFAPHLITEETGDRVPKMQNSLAISDNSLEIDTNNAELNTDELIDNNAELNKINSELNTDELINNNAELINKNELIKTNNQSQLTNNQTPIVMVDAALHAIEELIRKHPECLFYGQDVGRRLGGVFREAATLAEKFGDARVFNTPIQEAFIVGSTVGMSAVGLKPIVEVQFADYLFPGINQLFSEVSRSCYLSNGKFPVSMVLRVPIGAYGSGGPYHSSSIETIVTAIRGLKIAYPSNGADLKGLLKAAYYDPNPCVIFEHKGLYWSKVKGTEAAKSIEPAENYILPFGKGLSILSPTVGEVSNLADGFDPNILRGPSLAIITYGMGVHWSLNAAKQFEGQIEIIDLRTIFPLDEDLVFETVKKHGRCLVVTEEAVNPSFAQSLAGLIQENCFHYLDAPVRTLGAANVPAVPLNENLERAMIPSIEKVAVAIASLLAF